nr:hypothetical protein [Tanacetum cinerariifolium]
MKGYIDNLECLGHPVTLGLGVSLILIGLRKEFDGFVHNYNMHSLGKTINELHAMLKLHGQTLPKNNAPALHAIRVGLRASRKLKPGSLSLYMGKGQREAIKAIGVFYLCLPSGLEIVLNNCHYAPSITKGVISVSCLYEDGINCFVNNTIQVSRNNMVYFSSTSRDGIFEIALSNSYVNESSMYVEVENQLGKTIKLLRSDHGGEYMSQEFLDHLKDHGIIAHRTPPHTSQHNGIDYEETFSPVADIRAIRILIAISAYYDYEIWQMVVKTSFLNRYLNEEVYMEQPIGVKSYLGRCFAMKDLGEAAYILGIKIYRDRSRRVSSYTDAGYLTDADDLKSQTGYVFVLNNGVVDWKSAKQSISATSSTEAEYIAAFDASKEAVWVRKFIFRLGVVPTIKEPISVYCDNTRAIDVANESGITKGARHFCAKVHYLCEVIEYGDIKLKKVHTDDNLADLFTKALAFPKHSEHTRNIGMLPASSLM